MALYKKKKVFFRAALQTRLRKPLSGSIQWQHFPCYPPCHDSWLWTSCLTQAINLHRHKQPNKTYACLLPRHRTSGCSLSPHRSASENERSISEKKEMWLYNSSLCVPADTEPARSASLSHRSTLLLWQTGRLTSFILVAPLRSPSSPSSASSSSQTILTITSAVSAWLHSVPRCFFFVCFFFPFLLIQCGTPVDISAPTLHVHLKNASKCTMGSCQDVTKGQSTDLITFFLCYNCAPTHTHAHHVIHNNNNNPANRSRSYEDRLTRELYFKQVSSPAFLKSFRGCIHYRIHERWVRGREHGGAASLHTTQPLFTL